MATKNNPGAYDCYAAVEPDEPYFLVRANDPLAPGMVRGWAIQRVHQIMQGIKPNTPEQWDKVSEALRCASEMEVWRADKYAQPHERQNIIIPDTKGQPN